MKNECNQKELSVCTRRDALRSFAVVITGVLGGQHLVGCTSIAHDDAIVSTQRIPKNHQGELIMSIRVQIVSTVKQEKLAALMPFLEQNLPNVRGFDGCLSVTVLMNRESGLMVLDEEWLSVDHHQKYLAFIEENGILGQLASHFEGPPDIRYLDRVLI